MKSTILNSIYSPLDLKRLTERQLKSLAQELRKFIIDIVGVKEATNSKDNSIPRLALALIEHAKNQKKKKIR